MITQLNKKLINRFNVPPTINAKHPNKLPVTEDRRPIIPVHRSSDHRHEFILTHPLKGEQSSLAKTNKPMAIPSNPTVHSQLLTGSSIYIDKFSGLLFVGIHCTGDARGGQWPVI
jgi:hypothetical protein